MSKEKEAKKEKFERKEVPIQELEAILDRTKAGPLSPLDYETLKAVVETLATLTRELETKGASVQRLRKLVFGPSTEKMSWLFPDRRGQTEPVAPVSPTDSTGTPDTPVEPAAVAGSTDSMGSPDAPAEPATTTKEVTLKPKRKGHGRIGASDYTGARKVKIPHATLTPGCTCPDCKQGSKLRKLPEPKTLVRITAMAPIDATVYEIERFRCDTCGKVFTAEIPQGVGEEKYDETVSSMIGVLRYGTGMPFNRLEKFQENQGIPLPAGTQWELVDEAADRLEPAFDELIREAAQGNVLYNDDTTMKILDVAKEIEKEAAKANSKQRTGIFTTGIVSTGDGHPIALFFTGRQHAGENLKDVLAKRAADLDPPIQMSDGLDRNKPGAFEVIWANCLTHSRRKYVDVVDAFPEKCRYILETLGKVFHFEAVAKDRVMSPEERLLWHQTNSRPLMESLKQWFQDQFNKKEIEPNSDLGDAIRYMTKRWDKLTRFLQVAGAPLDSTTVERALKSAIRHRRNSLFYKTENGARVGDLFMSLIHTAVLNKENPFDYLVAIQRNFEDVKLHAAMWMPWNFRDRLSELARPDEKPD